MNKFHELSFLIKLCNSEFKRLQTKKELQQKKLR